jgi:hypothetical protein
MPSKNKNTKVLTFYRRKPYNYAKILKVWFIVGILG